MKNTIRIFGIIALVAVIGFTMAGCDNGNNPQKDFISTNLLQGSFASQRVGSGNAVFFANYGSSVNQNVARAVGGLSSTEKELVGKIEDGNIIFNLTGFHDTVSNQFFLSAGSSFLIYEIGGTLSSSGSISNSEATVKIKDGDGWTEITVTVSNNNSDVNITGTASAEQKAGIPLAWLGRWLSVEASWGPGVDTIPYYLPLTITAFHISFDDWILSFVDVKTLSAGKLELIVLYPEEIIPGYPGGNGKPAEPDTVTPAAYEKIWIEETANGLNVKRYYDSWSNSFAETIAFAAATVVNPAEIEEWNFVRTAPN